MILNCGLLVSSAAGTLTSMKEIRKEVFSETIQDALSLASQVTMMEMLTLVLLEVTSTSGAEIKSRQPTTSTILQKVLSAH